MLGERLGLPDVEDEELVLFDSDSEVEPEDEALPDAALSESDPEGLILPLGLRLPEGEMLKLPLPEGERLPLGERLNEPDPLGLRLPEGERLKLPLPEGEREPEFEAEAEAEAEAADGLREELGERDELWLIEAEGDVTKKRKLIIP